MSKRVKYRDQAEMREQRIATDDLGRPWVIEVEKETGQPTGPLIPSRGVIADDWGDTSDELVPPQQYLRYDAEKQRVVIYWRWWAEDLKRLIDPRTREPQPVTQEQLAQWRRVLEYVTPHVEPL